MLKLEIPDDIYMQMLAQARVEAPLEACGILAGANGKAEKIYKMSNVDAAGDHFMMEPAEQFGVVKDIRSKGLEMLAIYHSHPASPARPSAEDVRLALTPGVICVIVSLLEDESPATRGFLVDDGDVTEVPVDIVDRSE